MRCFFYSHDGFGLGHTRRHLAIAAALVEAAPRVSILLATGVDEAFCLGLPPNVDTLKLPGLRKLANDTYCPRRLEISTSDIWALRAELLRNAVQSFRPDLVLVDKHPFGARGEFLPALETAKARGTPAVLGLRDILDHPAVVRQEWEADKVAERIPDYYDRVLVYGNRAVFDPLAEYGLPSKVAARTRFCGFVVSPDDCPWLTEDGSQPGRVPPGSQPLVLATAGGGEDGMRVLEAFVRAAAGMPWRAVALAGPLMPPRDTEALRQLAEEEGAVFWKFMPCLQQIYRSVDAMVCMGGYNTLVEVASHGVPAVCVPRTAPRIEQLLRARAFERLGLVRTLPPEELTVPKLRAAVLASLGECRPRLKRRARETLGFEGARTAAKHLLALLDHSACAPRAVAAQARL